MARIYQDTSDTLSISESLAGESNVNLSDSIDIADVELTEEEAVISLGCILSDSIDIEESSESVSEFKLNISDNLKIKESVMGYDGEEIDILWQFIKCGAVCCHAGI